MGRLESCYQGKDSTEKHIMDSAGLKGVQGGTRRGSI